MGQETGGFILQVGDIIGGNLAATLSRDALCAGISRQMIGGALSWHTHNLPG